MKDKRPGLIEIAFVPIFNGTASHEFNVIIYNGLKTAVSNRVGIETNVPLLVMHEGNTLGKHGKPAMAFETRVISVPPASSVKLLFHWVDPSNELKGVRIRARFKHARTRWETFV